MVYIFQTKFPNFVVKVSEINDFTVYVFYFLFSISAAYEVEFVS